MPGQDAISGFTYLINSIDGCQMTRCFLVDEQGIREVPGPGWQPMPSTGCVSTSCLTTRYASGKLRTIDLEGDEHARLADNGGFEKLLSSIVRGNMPGEALKRQLTKAFDLPKLPKIKRLRTR